MKIDGAINYASFMQHFHPLDISDVREADVPVVRAADAASPVQTVSDDETQVQESVYNHAERVPYTQRTTALEDIAVDFGDGDADGVYPFESDGIRKAISDMEKDAVLHEYQYFIGNKRPETLVDNADGVVTRLADPAA